MNDQLTYLYHWGLTPGTEEANAAWQQKQDFDRGYRVFSSPMIFVDKFEAYESPIDGSIISSRYHRNEDLARSGCIEYDPEMKKDTQRRNEAAQLALEKSIDDHVEREVRSMDSRKLESLTNELESGAEATIERK